MTNLDKSAPEPSAATQDPAGDVISAAPATSTAPTAAPSIEQAPPQGSFAPAPGYAPTSAARYPNGSPLAGRAPVGRIRGTGARIALSVITLGTYSIARRFLSVHGLRGPLPRGDRASLLSRRGGALLVSGD